MKNEYTIKTYISKTGHYFAVIPKISNIKNIFEVYEISENVNSPLGVNAYLGEDTSFLKVNDYKKISIVNLPDEVINAIFERCKILKF
jgi:hypothetical protein